MRYNRWHCTENITVYADVDDVLDQISFNKIEEEYEKRLELKERDRTAFDIDEKYSKDDSQVEIEVDPDEHDLMSVDDEDLDDFDFEEIYNYIEDAGYVILEKGAFPADMSAMSSYIGDLSNWKFKEMLCDICSLSHLATKDDILKAIAEKIS